MYYCVYFYDDGEYSRPMTLAEATELTNEFGATCIVSIKTGEVIE